MRKVMTISLPSEMYEHLQATVSRVRYGSVSEYIRELIRKDLPVGDVGPKPDDPVGPQKAGRYDIDYRNIFDITHPNELIRQHREAIAAEKRQA